MGRGEVPVRMNGLETYLAVNNVDEVGDSLSSMPHYLASMLCVYDPSVQVLDAEILCAIFVNLRSISERAHANM